jgi:hypothetical protein
MPQARASPFDRTVSGSPSPFTPSPPFAPSPANSGPAAVASGFSTQTMPSWEEPRTAPPPQSAVGAPAHQLSTASMNDAHDHGAAEMWGDLLKYQLQCCGLRLGMQAAKKALTAMCVVVVVSATCAAIAFVALYQTDEAKTDNDGSPAGQVMATPDLNNEQPQRGDPCLPNPCYPGGQCSSGSSGNSSSFFYCVCENGWAGPLCKQSILDRQLKACKQLGCQHGGKCHSEGKFGRVYCICPTGFSGDHCETAVVLKDTNNPPVGLGVDITAAFDPHGGFAMKFAGLFASAPTLASASPKSGIRVKDNGFPHPSKSTEFYHNARDLLISLGSSLGLQYTSGMFSSDSWVAAVRQASFTARPRLLYGSVQRRVLHEQKTYLPCAQDMDGTWVTVQPPCMHLHSTFRDTVAALPNSLSSESNAKAFFEFFAKYGTHFVRVETYGTSDFAQFWGDFSNAEHNRSAFQRLTTAAEHWFDGHYQSTFDQGMSTQHSKTFARVELSRLGSKTAPDLIGAQLQPIATLVKSPVKRQLISAAYRRFLAQCPSQDVDEHDKTRGVCNNQGDCWSAGGGACVCDPGFRGIACSSRTCPSSLPTKDCSGNGGMLPLRPTHLP